MKKSRLTLLVFTAFALAACGNDKQAELEQQLKAQQEQIAQLKAQAASAADQTVYQLLPDAVNETLSPEAQQQGKNGEIVTGKDGQQYMYDSSTGSWFLQSLVGAAAGAFIGNALANKFARAPANRPRNKYAAATNSNTKANAPPRRPACARKMPDNAANRPAATGRQTAPNPTISSRAVPPCRAAADSAAAANRFQTAPLTDEAV